MLLAVVRNDADPVKLADRLWEMGLTIATIWSGLDDQSINTRNGIAVAFGPNGRTGKTDALTNKEGVGSYSRQEWWVKTSPGNMVYVLPEKEALNFVHEFCTRCLDYTTVRLGKHPGIVLDLNKMTVIGFL